MIHTPLAKLFPFFRSIIENVIQGQGSNVCKTTQYASATINLDNFGT